MFQVRPVSKGVSQPAQIPISIELGQGMSAPPVDLANAIQAEIRERLLVTADINLVSFGSVPRATYKSKLVDYSDAS
jgi:phenylacetate-CoA ligase